MRHLVPLSPEPYDFLRLSSKRNAPRTPSIALSQAHLTLIDVVVPEKRLELPREKARILQPDRNQQSGKRGRLGSATVMCSPGTAVSRWKATRSRPL